MSRRGFTLIEVLVAVVVLAVGLVAVMRGFETSLLALRESSDTLHANLIIAEKISQARAAGLSSDGSSSLASRDTSGTERGFSWKMEHDVVSMPVTDQKITNNVVKVTVELSGRGSTRKYKGQTYIQQ